MSFDIWDATRLRDIEDRQRQELNVLKDIIRKQDRQIALLEGILRSLESQKDIWGRSNADY
jgi:hypothetical protein